MAYEAKKFEYLLGIEGLSNQLLNKHFTLYQGHVANTNKLLEKLLEITKNGDLISPEFAEMKRRFGWEWNGMRLHELYFENLTKNGDSPDMNSSFAKKAAENFGSLENWKKTLKRMDRCASSAEQLPAMIRALKDYLIFG